MDSKKKESTEKVEMKKEQPKTPLRGRVIKNKTFTRRIDREAKDNG